MVFRALNLCTARVWFFINVVVLHLPPLLYLCTDIFYGRKRFSGHKRETPLYRVGGSLFLSEAASYSPIISRRPSYYRKPLYHHFRNEKNEARGRLGIIDLVYAMCQLSNPSRDSTVSRAPLWFVPRGSRSLNVTLRTNVLWPTKDIVEEKVIRLRTIGRPGRITDHQTWPNLEAFRNEEIICT